MKRIIILDKVNPGQWRYLLWAAVPAGREAMWLERQNHPTGSAWSGASAAEHAAIAAGEVVEAIDVYSKPSAGNSIFDGQDYGFHS